MILDYNNIKIKLNLTFLIQIIQLIIISWIIIFLNLEVDLGLNFFFPIVVISFILHHLTPSQYRPIILFASFVFTLYYFLSLTDASIVLLLGFGVFGICHLPVNLRLRNFLILIIGAILLFARLEIISLPFTHHGIIVFAAIFMFRVILYLHELKHEAEQISFWHRLNYFFIPTNIIFPLFPIIDFKTYITNYYNNTSSVIYQRGINLILWSIVCLLIYRWLYYYAIPVPSEILNVEDVWLYMITSYLTVFRLIGILSISVGILRLFGYNLPEIFNNMFLASSFSDIFRRINIYWKDFLLKICYYPVYFKIRKVSPNYALLIATIATFFTTWVFHIYQWFWVLGASPIRETDTIYWIIFGVLATISSLFESKKKKKKKSFINALSLSIKISVAFTTMAILYSLWISPSLNNWFNVVTIALNDSLQGWMNIGLYSLIMISVLTLGHLIYWNVINKQNLESFINSKRIVIGLFASCFMVIFALGLRSQAETNINLETFITNTKLNQLDQIKTDDGYYDDILKADIATKLWDDDVNLKSTNSNDKKTQPTKTKLAHWHTMDFVDKKKSMIKAWNKPNQKVTFREKSFHTNKWGLRDKHYDFKAPKNTIRIAIIGGSNTMGSGVHNEEVFEQIVEKKLNQNFKESGQNFEIMNFSGGGNLIYQTPHIIEHYAKKFKPDYILCSGHFAAYSKNIANINRLQKAGNTLDPNFIIALDSMRINSKNSAAKNKNLELGLLINQWAIREIIAISQEISAKPLFLHTPVFIWNTDYESTKKYIFENQGSLIDLNDVFNGYTTKEITVSDIDIHYNPLGHRLIAEQLYSELVEILKLNTIEEINNGSN